MTITNPVLAGPPRILVVDDEIELMGAVCAQLSYHGYDTTHVTSGSCALETLEASPFDILLTDLAMPAMDGITLLRAALKKHPSLVAIVMTGHAAIETAVEALQAGAMDYVVKPFRFHSLVPILNRAVTLGRLRQENAALEKRVREHMAELERANQNLESFAYTAAHDLRAPARAIAGYSEMLMSEFGTTLAPEVRRLVDRISDRSRQMENLIEALLNFARLSQRPLVKTEIESESLVRVVADEVLADHPDRRVEVTVGKLPNSWGDGTLIRQVFVNLLSNAVKFTAERKTALIHVACRIQEGTQIFSVHDNGVGFHQSDAQKIFTAFQQLHSAAEFDGNGLGLSIVERIINRHGGRIWAEGEPNIGATFSFSLPDDGPKRLPAATAVPPSPAFVGTT